MGVSADIHSDEGKCRCSAPATPAHSIAADAQLTCDVCIRNARDAREARPQQVAHGFVGEASGRADLGARPVDEHLRG